MSEHPTAPYSTDVWMALAHIAQGRVCDPQAFAVAVLDGVPVARAVADDAAILEAEPGPEVQIGIARVEARRELVRAALGLYRAEQDGKGAPYVALALPSWQAAERALYERCAAFLAAGGSEDEG